MTNMRLRVCVCNRLCELHANVEEYNENENAQDVGHAKPNTTNMSLNPGGGQIAAGHVTQLSL
jgi:hypothetical protein